MPLILNFNILGEKFPYKVRKGFNGKLGSSGGREKLYSLIGGIGVFKKGKIGRFLEEQELILGALEETWGSLTQG